jgi:hypothetical protein
MNHQPESTSRNLARSLSMGVLLSMAFFYSVHVLGTWETENYRPDPETTYTLLLHNKCAVFGKMHTLRPNTDISGMGDGIDGTKLSGSFMNFFDGHIAGMVISAILLGTLIFFLRRTKPKAK